MRTELNRIEQIERYLLGNMQADERKVFKTQLKTDNSLAEDLKWQKLLMNRLEKIAIKQEISLVHAKYMRRFRFSFKNNVFRNWFISISSVLVLSTVLSFYIKEVSSPPIKVLNNKAFVPIIETDKPFFNNVIDNNEPVLLKYNSGSFIVIQPNTFINDSGKNIVNDIELRFREITVNVNLTLEKLPKDSQSVGKSSELEFSQLYEIYALKDGKPLTLLPNKPIEVFLATENASNLLSIYNYNKPSWIKIGEDIPLELSGQVVDNQIVNELLECLHIENPRNNSEILREQQAYLSIIEQLKKQDSISFEIEKNTVGLNNEPSLSSEIYELYRQRAVLLNYIESGSIDSLLPTGISPFQLKSNRAYILDRYTAFKNNKLKLNDKLEFYRIFTINKTGLWGIAFPKKKHDIY